MKTIIVSLSILLIFSLSTNIVSGQISGTNKQEFDSLRQSLLKNLNECYYLAKKIPSSNNVWSLMSEGQEYYKRANYYYQRIKQPKYGLSQEKLQLIEDALSFYRKGFQNIGNPGNLGGFNEKNREMINKDLDGWPYKETMFEKNIKEGVIKLDIPAVNTRGIYMPKGTWCIWEITNQGRIWVDGYLPDNGYGWWDIFYDKLPIYLGDNENYFKIRNVCDYDITVIFKRCHKKD